MEEQRVWTKKETHLLIQKFESHPELWNVRSLEYKNRIKRQVALVKLGQLFERSENEIRRKLHNLRTQINQEWQKIQKKKSDGQGTGHLYKSSWEYFDSMKFIIDSKTASSTKDNMVTQLEDISKVQSLEKLPEKESVLPAVQSTFKNTWKQSKKCTKDDNIEYDNRKVMDIPLEEYQKFGDYVASELRGLRSDKLRRKLKLLIQKDILNISNEDIQGDDRSRTLMTSTPSKSPYRRSYSSSSTHQLIREEPHEIHYNIPAQTVQLCIPGFDIDTSENDTSLLE